MLRVPKKKRPKNVKVVGAGEEPAEMDFTSLPEIELAKAYNWYNYVLSQKDARLYVEGLYKKIDWDAVPHSRQVPTYAWVLKMQERDCIFPESLTTKLKAHFADLERDFPKIRKKIQVQETPKEPEVFKFPDRKYVADFDEIEDMIIGKKDFKGAEQAFKVFSSSLTRAVGEEVKNLIVPKLEELQSKDRDVKEAYSHLAAKEKKGWIDFYQNCLNQIDFTFNAKRAAKPRKVKVVPLEKKLKHLKYRKADPALSLVSISPEKLFGAKILWTWNSKYRELTKFESTQGFDLKGTTLQNVTRTQRKRIRKPDLIREFFGSTKGLMDRNFDAIKTKPSEHNCRINEETLLMKVF